MEKGPEKRFCDLKNGAVMFGLSVVKLKQMATKGEIPATKGGSGKWLIDIEAMTEQLRKGINKAA